jgi:archaellum biogenesis protein FlaJ (TadC family)
MDIIDIKKEAEELAEKYKKKYLKELSKIDTQLEIYNSLLLNLGNVEHLYEKYKKENNELLKELKNTTNDILTNERKTYYEDQEIETLNSYYVYIFWIIYIIAILCFIIFSLIYPTQTSLLIRILLLGVFIVLPFISTWILGKIIELTYWLISFIPKNVYR